MLFRLRGDLPPSTFLLFQVVGIVLILLLWQGIASIRMAKTQSFDGQRFAVYHSTANPTPTSLANPTILVYDRPNAATPNCNRC